MHYVHFTVARTTFEVQILSVMVSHSLFHSSRSLNSCLTSSRYGLRYLVSCNTHNLLTTKSMNQKLHPISFILTKQWYSERTRICCQTVCTVIMLNNLWYTSRNWDKSISSAIACKMTPPLKSWLLFEKMFNFIPDDCIAGNLFLQNFFASTCLLF